MTEKVKEIRITKNAALKLNGELEIKEFFLLPSDIEERLHSMRYQGEGLIKDSEVENAKLPPINFSFYILVFENEEIPTIAELLDKYSEGFEVFDNFWTLKGKSYNSEGVKARVQRTYPSLIRDLHFLALCLDSDCFDKVRFSLVDDYYNGIDLRLEYAEFDFEIAL